MHYLYYFLSALCFIIAIESGNSLTAKELSYTKQNLNAVQVSLQASWPVNNCFDPILQASEYLADENPNLFWKFVNCVEVLNQKSPICSSTGNVSGKYVAHQCATGLVKGLTSKLLHMVIETRAYAASLETHRSLAVSMVPPCITKLSAQQNASDTWINVLRDGKLLTSICSPDDIYSIDSFLTPVEPLPTAAAVFDFDHFLPGAKLDLAGSADAEGVRVQSLDSIHEPSTFSVVVYGLMGSDSATQMHDAARKLVAAAQQKFAGTSNIVELVWRHSVTWNVCDNDVSKSSCLSNSMTYLSGYGVGLDIKNLEYKMMDEKTSNNTSQTLNQEEIGTEFREAMGREWVGDGFYIEKLNSLRPTRKRDRTEPDTDDEKLTKWKDIGFKVAAHLVATRQFAIESYRNGSVDSTSNYDAALYDPLVMLQRVTGNFPLAIQELLRVNVPRQLRSEILRNQRTIPSGHNIVLVNGRVVDVTSVRFNLFSLMRTLQREASVISQLYSLPIPVTDIRKIQSMAGEQQAAQPTQTNADEDHATDVFAPGADVLRVDFRRGAARVINFVNNIEKDAAYRSWPRSLSLLLRQSWQIHQIRRNIYTVVFIMDASRPGSLRALSTVSYMLRSRAAIRFGFVFVNSPSDEGFLSSTDPLSVPEDSAEASGLQFTMLVNALKKQYGSQSLLRFLDLVVEGYQHDIQAFAQSLLMADPRQTRSSIEQATKSRGVNVGTLMAAYAQVASMLDNAWSSHSYMTKAREILRDESREGRSGMQKNVRWLHARGLPTNCMVMNGRIIDGLDAQQDLMKAISGDMELLVQLIRSKRLSDDLLKQRKESVLSYILSSGAKVARYDKRILEERQMFLSFVSDEATPLMKPSNSMAQGGLSFAAGAESLVAGLYAVSILVYDNLGTIHGVEQSLAALNVTLQGEETHSTPGAKTSDKRSLGPLATAHISHNVRIALIHGSNNDADRTNIKSNSNIGNWIENIARCISLHAPAHTSSHLLYTWLEDLVLPWLLDNIQHDESSNLDTFLTQTQTFLNEYISKQERVSQYKKLEKELLSLLSSNETDLFIANLNRQIQYQTAILALLEQTFGRQFEESMAVARTSLRLVMANGRVMMMEPSEVWTTDAFATLCVHERVKRGAKLAHLLRDSTLELPYAQNIKLTQQQDRNLMQVMQFVSPDDVTPAFVSNIVAAASSVIGLYTSIEARESLPEDRLRTTYTLLDSQSIGSDTFDKKEPSGIDVVALLDPVSYSAQRVAPVLLALRDVLGASIRIYLNPGAEHNQNPLPSFYRFVSPSAQPHSFSKRYFHEDVDETARMALFTHIPGSPVTLTTKIYPPEPWNVQEYSASNDHDLDNMRLTNEFATIKFELKNLLVAGQCDDLTMQSPPNGLQLTLSKHSSTNRTDQRFSDTLVMQNLGYFQLKANPGVWDLELAPGRASSLYNIIRVSDKSDLLNHTEMSYDGHIATNGASTNDERSTLQMVGGIHPYGWLARNQDQMIQQNEQIVSKIHVVVRDFTGPITQLKVRKVPGLEHIRLLDSLGEEDMTNLEETHHNDQVADKTQESSSLWHHVSSFFGSSENEPSRQSKDNRIHVFSLASGHLYERFLRIMMLSVVKRASRPVTFWLVENFLSPNFKDTIQYMAERYGFQVGLVTYKWPNWLHQETEKQRIIWGYKILFLDVLFPLNVTKIITVDADQVVRADLAELWDMDLKGAPYAYTPFCTSRKETLGFQFWRSGYWADHLRGKPYHISALYVVDLVKFRRAAVGDRLRGIYDGLARDPNSLSNLDQDLPNFAQHAVPIYSLPTEWLWCESWCGDDTKANAKTIDLCNNPLHKEPKLDMAKRVISGSLFQEDWVELDAEVAEVLRQGTLKLPHTSEQEDAVRRVAAEAAGKKLPDDSTIEVEVLAT